MIYSFVFIFGVAVFNALPGQASQFSDSVNCFTLNLYKKLAETNPNLISSPFSADLLLSLLLTASAGKTAAQLKSALNYDNPQFSNNVVAQDFKSSLASLVSSNGKALQIANSIWCENGFPINSDFYNTASDYFQADVDGSLLFDVNPENATGTINNWAKSKTNGLIPKIFDQTLPRDTLMVLANALYFKGSWEKKFKTDDTFTQSFYNNGNDKKDVPFMNQEQSFSWTHDSGLEAQFLEMNYIENNVSMIIGLPDDGSSLGQLEQKLNCNTFKQGYQDLIEKVVQVTVPKFTSSSSLDLITPLKALGVKELFSQNADLSGLVSEQSGPKKLSVASVVQKATVKVDEEGSEAAAVTAVRVCRSCSAIIDRSISFKANKPFLYFIRHKPTDIILFMGRISTM